MHPDADRWNQRFLSAPADWYQTPRSFLRDNLIHLPHHGLALDAAMGPGQNAALLVEHGLRVIGIDVSSVAVEKARRHLPTIMAIIADLNDIWLPRQHFNVILNLYYLQRSLFPLYKQALKPGGVLVFEALTVDMLQIDPSFNRAHLLELGELRETFAGWDILAERQGWIESDHGNQKAVASLVTRRPFYS